MNQVMTTEEIAEALSLSSETIRRLTRAGQLPHHVIGGSVRYVLSDVLEWTCVKKHPDDEAVDRFAAAMHAKMASARAKGKEGWDDPARCPLEHLGQLMDDSRFAGDWVDVANYAMMLWAREQAK